jgi:serine phosphatase RsbU (regulator of sigma subunit)
VTGNPTTDAGHRPARSGTSRLLGWCFGIAAPVALVAVIDEGEGADVWLVLASTAVVIGVTLLGGFLPGMVSALVTGVLAWHLFDSTGSSGVLVELAFVTGGIALAFYVEAGLELRARGQQRKAWLDRLNRLAEHLSAADQAADPAEAIRTAGDAAADPERPVSPALAGEHATFLRSVADQCNQALARRELQIAEQRAQADLEFLARASDALAAHLEIERVIAALDDLVVPYVADECSLTLARRFGQPPVRAAAPPDDDEMTRTIELVARGKQIGTLTLRRTSEPFGAADQSVATQLAARAAQALDHALLFAEQATTSSTLEHSLLPEALLPIPNLQVATRYLAAAEGHAVGGDFYDVLRRPDGAAVLLIGDVQGKGVGAATLTSVARHTLRAGGFAGARPADMLHQLNEALLYGHAERMAATGKQTVRFVTAAVAVLEPTATGFTATIAGGGHPPLLVIRPDGTVDQVESTGPLLGVFEGPCFEERFVDLALADILVLYTDGVTEQREQPDVFNEQQLGRMVRNLLTSRQADDIAQLILDTVVDLAPRDVRDDIALVVARVTGPR